MNVRLEAKLRKAVTRRRREVFREVRVEEREIELSDGRRMTVAVKIFPTLEAGGCLIPMDSFATPWGTLKSKRSGARQSAISRARNKRSRKK